MGTDAPDAGRRAVDPVMGTMAASFFDRQGAVDAEATTPTGNDLGDAADRR